MTIMIVYQGNKIDWQRGRASRRGHHWHNSATVIEWKAVQIDNLQIPVIKKTRLSAKLPTQMRCLKLNPAPTTNPGVAKPLEIGSLVVVPIHHRNGARQEIFPIPRDERTRSQEARVGHCWFLCSNVGGGGFGADGANMEGQKMRLLHIALKGLAGKTSP